MKDAYTAQEIMETVIGSLRSRAVVEVMAITTMGQLYVRDYMAIRWNFANARPEVFVGDQWLLVIDRGIATWAEREGLQWEGEVQP